MRNLPRFDGTKPQNYRDWYSKTRVILSLSSQSVLGVLNGLTEPIPIFTLTPRTSGQIWRKSDAGSEHATSSQYTYCSSLPAALQPYWFDNTKTGLRLWSGKWTTDVERFARQILQQQQGGTALLLREASELLDGEMTGSGRLHLRATRGSRATSWHEIEDHGRGLKTSYRKDTMTTSSSQR